MLPPKELNTTCQRCGAAVALEQRYCAGCGADRELELAVAGQLHPAMSILQRWLGALAVIEIVNSGMDYLYLRMWGSPVDPVAVMAPGFIQAGWLVLLCLVARVLPLGASLVALGMFAARLGAAIMADPVDVFSPGPVLILRILFLIVLIGAVHAGWRARGLRQMAGDAFPSAVARIIRVAAAAKDR
ncbi:MAG TPA: hypothetical protein VK698_24580 [Kofleriaceae bacterium]|nr:hypothetical protein [Kofleriaceae bacterium]